MGAQLFMLKKKRLQNKLVKNSGILNFGIFFYKKFRKSFKNFA